MLLSPCLSSYLETYDLVLSKVNADVSRETGVAFPVKKEEKELKKKGVLVLSLKKNTFAAVTSKGSAAQEWGIQVSVSNAESKGVGKKHIVSNNIGGKHGQS